MSRLNSAAAVLAALPVLLIQGCGAEPTQPQKQQALQRIPQDVCDRNKAALEQLQDTAMFEFNDQGTATMSEEAWNRLGGEQHDQIGTSVAVHAACAAKEPPTEQAVTIRADTGRTLATRIVEVGVSAESLLDE